MARIVPRWEWRTFGARFGIAEAAFAALTPGPPQESEEIYFLGGEGAIVKVRDALMDIKLLREVNADQLERWEPVLKQPFPLPAADAAKVFASLGLAAPVMARGAYTLDQFASELCPLGPLRPMKVRKRRVRYTIQGCAAEFSDIWADDKPSRTIAIESEDAAAVVAAVTAVGLTGYVNTNYPRGLQALLGGAAERYAVIDVGTNSVKLHIAERLADGWRTVIDRAELTRLGEGLDATGEIAPQAAARTADAIAEMAAEARRSGVRAIAAVGTAGLRIASNGASVIDQIRARAGVSVTIITGEEESRLAYLAVKAGLGVPAGSLVVFDTGGGSSQFTFGEGDRVDERFSVDVGAARYTERFGLDSVVSRERLRDATAAIAADLARLDGRMPPDALVAMGGAVTNLAAVSHAMATYDPDIIQGTVLDRAEIDRQIELYRTKDADARRSITGLQPKRAEVILAGAGIVRTVMEKLGAGSLTVSDRGLRHGVLAERFG